jgi:hypothetical protein
MIINLKKSSLFTENPVSRFAKEHHDIWGEIWRRYISLGYSVRDICDYYHIKTGQRIQPQTIKRWIWRTEIYKLTEPIMEKGVELVKSSYFREHEERVIKELLKNISEHPNSKILP